MKRLFYHHSMHGTLLAVSKFLHGISSQLSVIMCVGGGVLQRSYLFWETPGVMDVLIEMDPQFWCCSYCLRLQCRCCNCLPYNRMFVERVSGGSVPSALT